MGTARTDAGGLAQAQLDELLERGEISREAVAEDSATADIALASTRHNWGHTYNSGPSSPQPASQCRFTVPASSTTFTGFEM